MATLTTHFLSGVPITADLPQAVAIAYKAAGLPLPDLPQGSFVRDLNKQIPEASDIGRQLVHDYLYATSQNDRDKLLEDALALAQRRLAWEAVRSGMTGGGPGEDMATRLATAIVREKLPEHRAALAPAVADTIAALEEHADALKLTGVVDPFNAQEIIERRASTEHYHGLVDSLVRLGQISAIDEHYNRQGWNNRYAPYEIGKLLSLVRLDDVSKPLTFTRGSMDADQDPTTSSIQKVATETQHAKDQDDVSWRPKRRGWGHDLTLYNIVTGQLPGLSLSYVGDDMDELARRKRAWDMATSPIKANKTR